MLVTAVLALEPWPLTSFRLFSTVRADEQAQWLATTVDEAGAERPYPLGGEDRGFRGFPFTMAGFGAADPERQDELCRLWVASAPELVGVDPVEVRLYLRSWELSARSGERALPGSTELIYVCTEAGADDGD